MKTGGVKPYPWADAMRFGFGVLKLAPRDFWSMTPRELAAAAVAVFGEREAFDADALGDLMRRFPDEEMQDGRG